MLRIEPDGQKEVLFREGDSASSGEKLTYAWHPHILAGGEVVFLSGRENRDNPRASENVVVIADGKQMKIAIRESAWEAELASFNDPQIEELRAADSGHVGILVKDGVFKNALLLATPRLSGETKTEKKE